MNWKSDTCISLVIDLLITHTEKFCLFHLVPTSHFSSQIPLFEWRVSCSLLELLLCRSLTTVQRQVYLAFKYLVKDATKDHTEIKSYYLKTTLLWTVENTPANVWREDNLAQCFYLLLDKLINFLAEIKLPNYFILENNLLAHLSKDQVQPFLDALHQLRKDPVGHIMKFQQQTRMYGHCTNWESSFQLILFPHLDKMKKILGHYKIGTIQIKDCAAALKTIFKMSMLDISRFLLIEYEFEGAFQTVMAYQQLEKKVRMESLFLHHPRGSFPCPEEILYKFLVSLCQTTSLHYQSIGIQSSQYLLKFMYKRLESMDLLSKKQRHLLRILEAVVNSYRALPSSENDEHAQIALDQSVIVFDTLINEQEDFITLCEYLCFFARLWKTRSARVGCKEFIFQARKFTHVVQTLFSAIQSNRENEELIFYGTWKSLHETATTNFLEVPHEIMSLHFAIMTMNRELLPKAESFLSQSESCQQCKHESTSTGTCQILALELRELLKVLTQYQNMAEQLFFTMGFLYIRNPLLRSFHGDVCTCVGLFLVSWVKTYLNKWEDAVDFLSGLSSFSCCQSAHWYLNICRLVVLYRAQNKQLSEGGIPGSTSNEEGKCCHDEGSPLYDIHADMSTYGCKQASDPRISKQQLSSKITQEEYEDKIILGVKEKTVVYLYDRILEGTKEVSLALFRGLRRDFVDVFYEELKSKTADGWAPKTFEDMEKLFDQVCKTDFDFD